MYELKSIQFSGPLEKLLELIETKHLEVTRLSLAEVTEDFLQYIRKLGEGTLSAEIADFLVVAARLLLIKSKVLLPELTLTEEEESDIRDLEARLAIYREFAARSSSRNAAEGPASRALIERWGQSVSHGRPLFYGIKEGSVFYPDPQITVRNLTSALEQSLATLQEFTPHVSEIKGTIISLQEKISEFLNRFREVMEHSFRGLVKDRPRGEIVVMFLALLHLLKEQSVSVMQEDQFSDIIVRKTHKTNDLPSS